MIGEAELQDLAQHIPWSDEPMPDDVLADLYRTAILHGPNSRTVRTVQEIARLRQQVGALRRDLREVRAELDEHRKLQTLGGPLPPFTGDWRRGTLPPPPSASDPGAPPHERE